MVSQADNDLLTRIGPGTPMGQVMRRYWMPALLTAELPDTDCPPVRVRLLGESLVAFRDTSGQIGLEDACPTCKRPYSWAAMKKAVCVECFMVGNPIGTGVVWI